MSQFQFSSRTNQTHPVHICSPHHIRFPWPVPELHKSYENMHTVNLLRLGKNSSYYYTFLPPQVYPVLRIIHELKGKTEKPSSRKTFIYDMKSTKMDIKKKKEGNTTQVPANQRFFSSVLYSTVSKKNSCTKFTPECQELCK